MENSSPANRAAYFPSPNEISFECSYVPGLGMNVKNVAAALYGSVSVRLEEKPSCSLKAILGVDHAELVGGAAEAVPRLADGAKRRKVVRDADLSALFGIELESSTAKVATTSTDGAGDRSHTRAEAPRARRAKSAKGADSATELNEVAAKARGTRRGTKSKMKRN